MPNDDGDHHFPLQVLAGEEEVSLPGQNVLELELSWANLGNEQVRDHTLEPKLILSMLSKYDGDPKLCRRFITQCSLHIELMPTQFVTEQSKVAFITSLLSWHGLLPLGQKKTWMFPRMFCPPHLNFIRKLIGRRRDSNTKHFPSSRTRSPSPACDLQPVPVYEDYEYVQEGDIIFGGMFSVHSILGQIFTPENPYIRSMFCIKPLHQFYRNLQIFLFAIDQINKEPMLLPNVTLGYHIFDSCSHPQKAIKNVLQMLSGPGVTVPNYSCRETWRLAGFIGDQSSTTTLPISRLLSAYKYPVISYGATDPSLSFRNNFPHFFRTIPNDFDIIHNLCKLLKHFGWNWVGIVTSHNESGERESSLLIRFLYYFQICIAFILENGVKSYQNEASIYQKILRFSVKVVILCGTYHDLMFEPPVGQWFSNVTLILTPSWGANIVLIEKYPEIFNGSLSLDTYSEYNVRLKNFIDGFYPLNYPEDKLLEDLWMTLYHCASGVIEKDKLYERIYEMSLRNCTGREPIKDSRSYLHDNIFDPVFNAVFILAHTLHLIHYAQSYWPRTGSSYRFQVYRALKHLTRFGEPVFTSSGEIPQEYHVHNHIIVNQTLFSRAVGYISPAIVSLETFPSYVINESLIIWKTINNKDESQPGSQSVLKPLGGVILKTPNRSIVVKLYLVSKDDEGRLDGMFQLPNTRNFVDAAMVSQHHLPVVRHEKLLVISYLSGQILSYLVRYHTKPLFLQKNVKADALSRASDVVGKDLAPQHLVPPQRLLLAIPVDLRKLPPGKTYIRPALRKRILNWIPNAQCSNSCLPGSRKVPSNSIYFCCYGCIPCSEGEISNKSDNEKCERCPDHEWPNDKKTKCVSKLVEFLFYSNDVISVIVLSGSMLFLSMTAIIMRLFIIYQDTPIVRANNKNLSFVLLVSIMLSFLCVFLFLGRPGDITCMLRQISTGIFLSVSISSLLAKTITVYIAFKATRPGSVWRTWTGVRLPNCVLLICSSVQVVLCMSWVTLSPPFQELDTHSYKEKVIVQCNEGSDLWFYSVLGYMGVLAAVSFITAFLARTLPDSFNEAKYITFSMLVFCSVWIAMIPAYLSTRGKYMVAVEIFAILTCNAGLLGCIFLPKCYIILFKPELNTRKYVLEPKHPMSHH
ncbi:vomeronasal type-2 receptor 26-like [Engystomops pustulosus]|uniref:vomeronasal type-2 receptor 26-like n=1 Tax=Engystomops pustulosus TaxID=76066 RepID=UPI003AFAA11D